MKQVLQLKLSQQLTLTPQLQQSIRLLQLSTLEFNQELEQLIAENPLLERHDDPLDSALRVAGDGSLHADRPAPGASPASPAGEARSNDSDDAEDPRSGDEAASDGWNMRDYGRSNHDPDDESEQPQLAMGELSLREHLLDQMSGLRLDRRDRALLTVLIEALDEDGYLRQEFDELTAIVPPELAIDEDEWRTALAWLQSFDPPGVGARNASECLALQLRASSDKSGLAENESTRKLALSIVSGHIELLATRDFAKLKRVLHCDDDALRAAHLLIRSLEPHPGHRFTRESTESIIPDVIVRKIKGVWRATPNPDAMPRLYINQAYARILREQRGIGNSASLAQRLQEARWVIKNVEQRFDTILRVSEAIVERQRNFFTHGEVAMRPLVLREIADTLGLHESTVSRVTTQKYMLTPLGSFELKYFFGSHVATEAGGAASSTAIRALIRQLVGAENPKSPLSDSQIAEMLGEQGIVVARRTIAKYREALRIPPVSLRKTL